jgi:ribosomal protein L11 methyltransferase
VTLRGYLPVDAHVSQGRQALEAAVWHVAQIAPGKLVGPTFREVREEDWANTWRQYYRPQRIGQRLLLGPTWEEFSSGPDDIVLRLDPGNAFGTGLHPTTRLALQLLETTPLNGRRLLDVGAGSGVLAIAGALMGADAVLALDTSPDAVRVTTANARVNGRSERVTALEGSLEVVRAGAFPPFDVVVANIVAKVLTLLAGELTAAVAPGGQLLLSGIIEPAELELMVTFGALGFLPVERLAEGDWRALRLQRET